MNQVLIRPATTADLALLVRLDAEIFEVAGYSEAQWQSELNSSGAMQYIAGVKGDASTALGFLAGSLAGDDFEIRKIGVIAAGRRHGVARQLLQAAAAAAVLLLPRSARCLIDVAEDNLPALAFYENLGFTKVARRKRYYANGAHAIVMEKILSGL